ncbi:type II toxin-antitoxin system RelE/ParE family toxin [Acidaminobacter sp. JC074]|uniref:type II toxin-antitoxin system RelE family toxin n=1 Tax=Acidaminobacter sp. JC074 TaxID=2530199 RepID=UPI001F0D2713|nr:type II toxin-antitoxin system RelE/ParE family toxin [Acidaminobacter sp. JC074]MCH4888600.1 type II toxin-antitoxin system RelE/ParE family toxin [Acidaminobacter sp. JC074]
MIYKVEYTKTALSQLKKIDKKIASFIVAYIEDKLVDCDNPRRYGKALKGNLNDKWRYRVGDYRILAKIEDDIVVITVVEVGHRRDIYEK